MSDPTPKNPEDMTKEELAASIDAQVAAQRQEPPAPEPEATPETPEEPAAPPQTLSYTAADGTVYTAASTDELFKKVTKALDHAKTTVVARERELSELRPKPTPEPEKYNHNKYLELLAEDGISAQEYLDSFRPDIQKTRQIIAESEETANRRKALLAFHSAIPEYAKVETPEITEAFKQRLNETGRAITADNLKLTYFELRSEGKIPAVLPAPEPPAPPPPPSPSGSRRTTSKLSFNPETLSREKLREYIEKENQKLKATVN